MATNFSNLRFEIDAETRLSRSTWQECGRFYVALAIFRFQRGKWALDHDTAVEFSDCREWMASTRAGFREVELYRQETGEVMPLGFYRNARIGR